MAKNKDRVQKKRVVVWEKADKAGNETAFATIDLRVPSEGSENDAQSGVKEGGGNES